MAHLSKALKRKSLFTALHDTCAVTLHEIHAAFQGGASNSSPNRTDSTRNKLQMEVNKGEFPESRRKTRNNSPDAAQRSTNEVTLTQQAMVCPNKQQATAAINHSLEVSN
jgi:hypothetical protein